MPCHACSLSCRHVALCALEGRALLKVACHLPAPWPLQVELAWQRSRHHARARPHLLLQAAAAPSGAAAATFAFSPTATQLAFLLAYQLRGTHLLPLGAAVEMAMAAAAACLGDSTAATPQLVMAGAAAPALVQLPGDDDAAAAAVLCSQSLHSGQVAVAAGPNLQLCFTAQLELAQEAVPLDPPRLASTPAVVSSSLALHGSTMCGSPPVYICHRSVTCRLC